MRRYNAARSPERISLERRLEEGQSIKNNNNSNDKAQTNYHQMSNNLRRRKAILLFCCILFFVIILLRTTTNFISTRQEVDIKRYGPAINTTNPFISKFETTLLTDDLRHDNNFWVPLIYNTKDNKLLCREKHRNQLSSFRSRSYTQMIRTYLTSNNNVNIIFNTTETTTTIPILIMDADGNGCNIHHHRDDYGYPRLAWSELHNAKHGEYCNAISMPSYETWRYHHSTKKVSSDWESTFITNEYHYPWNTKINKAIWRGSTTYEGSQYGNAELKDTPRGKLVQIASSTSLIDAGFTKINQKFSKQKNELKDQFNVAKRVHPSDMMKYKAIIDIDGNNWSSRFGTLLCSNSVVIKIEPDFIEYFYNTKNGGEVKPMIHYVPASLHNITQVVEYVMDTTNENEMKSIVREANKWCAKDLSEEGLAQDSMIQLQTYKKALDIYANMDDDWNKVFQRFSDTLDDLVDCKAWSIIDWFLFPMFMGL